ncbi:MAG: hypothetical protein ACR2OH_13410 [Microthrixaceae bacterium]
MSPSSGAGVEAAVGVVVEVVLGASLVWAPLVGAASVLSVQPAATEAAAAAVVAVSMRRRFMAPFLL